MGYAEKDFLDVMKISANLAPLQQCLPLPRWGRVFAQRYRKRKAVLGVQSAMMQSFVIDISGIFAGVAIRTPSLYGESFRFVAIDPRIEDLDQSQWPSLEAVRRAAEHLHRTGRLSAQAKGTRMNP